MAFSNNQTNTEKKSGWTCQSCGTTNAKDVYFCQKCYVSHDGKEKMSEATRRRAEDTFKALTKQSGLPAAPTEVEPTGPIHTSTLPTGPVDMSNSLLAQRFDPPPPFNEPPEATRPRVEYDVKAVTNQSRLPAARTAAYLYGIYTSTLPTGPNDMSSSLLAQRFAPPPSRATEPVLVTQRLMRKPIKPATQSTAHSLSTGGTASDEKDKQGDNANDS
ncbi:hypothetical protein V8F33_012519 [Rhypophila sp. PSN 637]